eukprot:TRINITY_DN4872_c0_g1_i2.p1 TRINITY_DN4872_c0_g1~~TRINITY_DN4872_c0_g1_i2.p1  ORF type:complete len:379 (+),score=123.75 TRINITY_DN4872_c0_g1_i2:99-1235(+)
MVAVKKIDPNDGKAYTRQQFQEQYGGLMEWNAAVAAPPRQAASRPTGPVAQDLKLVEQVKELQRNDASFRLKWVQWCDQNAEGTKDPILLQDSQLRTALRVCQQGPPIAAGRPAGGRGVGGVPVIRRIDPADGGAYTRAEFIQEYGGLAEWHRAVPIGNGVGRGAGRPGVQPQGRGPVRSLPYTSAPGVTKQKGQPATSDQQALAEQVRNKQRADPEFRQKWVEFCESNKSPGAPSGTKDPHLHTAQFLRKALAEIAGVNPSAVAVLAQTVMEKQRSDADFRGKWIAFCARETNNTCDPRRLDDQTLQRALKECDAEAAATVSTMIERVEQVRAKQRESKEWVAQWAAWCKQHNNGTLDPARFTAEKLAEAWQALKDL